MAEYDGIGGTDMVHPAKLRGDRYTTIRKHLAQAKERGTLTNDTYLLAQIALVMCDVSDAVDEMNAYLHELAVHK